MDKKEQVTVYWAPDTFPRAGEVDWNILYNSPVSVYSSLKAEANKDMVDKANNLLFCPAVKDVFVNTYKFSSSLGAEYKFDTTSQEYIRTKENSIGFQPRRASSLINRLHISLSLGWLFFSEEPLLIKVTPPFFDGATHLAYGSIVPGEFDIGQWFRPVNAEFILNKDVKEFKLNENEPIMYVKFMTDKKVVLKRFSMNSELESLSKSCSQSMHVFGRFIPLNSKYKTFALSKTNKKVLKEIQKNIIE